MCNKTSKSLDPGSLHNRFKIIHVLPLILVPFTTSHQSIVFQFYSIPSSVVSTSIASVTNKLESANHLSNGKET
jgi:hypothetical protein